VDIINSNTFRLDLTMAGQDCNTQSAVRGHLAEIFRTSDIEFFSSYKIRFSTSLIVKEQKNKNKLVADPPYFTCMLFVYF
jgi:hypothetical protein